MLVIKDKVRRSVNRIYNETIAISKFLLHPVFLCKKCRFRYELTQILDQIKATWGGEWKNEETEQKLIQEIVSVPVLVIDDIGVEAVKPWINERFYNILNGRMIEKRVTIFTSNCRMEELNFDDRIINRIIKMALPVQFPDESIRTAIARKENDDLLDRLLGA